MKMMKKKREAILWLTALIITFGISEVSATTGDKVVTGTVVSVSHETRSIVLKTEVATTTGSEMRDVTYSLAPHAVVTVCWADVCNSRPAADGIALLDNYSRMDSEGLQPEGREASIIYRGGEIAHVKVSYMEFPMHGHGFSGTYDFREE